MVSIHGPLGYEPNTLTTAPLRSCNWIHCSNSPAPLPEIETKSNSTWCVNSNSNWYSNSGLLGFGASGLRGFGASRQGFVASRRRGFTAERIDAPGSCQFARDFLCAWPRRDTRCPSFTTLRSSLLDHQPPWPNGQGVGLLIRRLRVRVPQGVAPLTEPGALAAPATAACCLVKALCLEFNGT